MALSSQDIINSNKLDLTNRLDACSNTPLVNPDEIPFHITRISNKPGQEIYVVRDDFICGGGKSRYSFDFIKMQVLKGYREFVYISPWYGAAAIALAWSLKVISDEMSVNLQGTIFMDEYPLFEIGELPSFIKIGMMYGAHVIQIPFDQDKFKIAEEYASNNDALLLKPGFDYPEVIDRIADATNLIKNNYGEFDEVWAPVGSGTLIRGIQKGNIAKTYFGVCIFKFCPDIGDANPIIHYQDHDEPVNPNYAPPFRSSLFYDSKCYQYVKNRIGKILLWNVA